MDVCFTEFSQSRQFWKYNFWSGPTGLVKRSKQHKRVARYTCILIWLGGPVGLDVPVEGQTLMSIYIYIYIYIYVCVCVSYMLVADSTEVGNRRYKV